MNVRLHPRSTLANYDDVRRRAIAPAGLGDDAGAGSSLSITDVGTAFRYVAWGLAGLVVVGLVIRLRGED